MNEISEISDEQKIKLGCEGLAAFFDQFEPLDKQSMIFIEVLMELLKGRRYVPNK